MMWLPPMQKIEFVTVKEMYGFSQLNNQPLLSDYMAEFWSEYTQNFARYDRVFNRLYRDFYYFNQDANLTADVVTPEFTEDVYGLLLMNHKRYSELYRVHVVDDTKYSILDNYDVIESRSGEYTKDITDNYGQRSTTGTGTIGQQVNEMIGKVAPYDSETFSNESSNTQTLGARNDTTSSTQAAAEDTHAHEGTDSYTLNRKGNIGVQTQTEVMEKHAKFWKGFNFYKIIFDDICRELLLIDKAYV